MGKGSYRGNGKGKSTEKMWKEVKKEENHTDPKLVLEALCRQVSQLVSDKEMMSVTISHFKEEHKYLKERVVRLEKENEEMNQMMLGQKQSLASLQMELHHEKENKGKWQDPVEELTALTISDLKEEHDQLKEQVSRLQDHTEAIQCYLDTDESASQRPLDEEELLAIKKENAERLAALEEAEAWVAQNCGQHRDQTQATQCGLDADESFSRRPLDESHIFAIKNMTDAENLAALEEAEARVARSCGRDQTQTDHVAIKNMTAAENLAALEEAEARFARSCGRDQTQGFAKWPTTGSPGDKSTMARSHSVDDGYLRVWPLHNQLLLPPRLGHLLAHWATFSRTGAEVCEDLKQNVDYSEHACRDEDERRADDDDGDADNSDGEEGASIPGRLTEKVLHELGESWFRQDWTSGEFYYP